MPSCYAHYRFGKLTLPALPEEARRVSQRFRQLYDVGLHGPDLLFYYQPLFHTKTGSLASRYHKLTGREFFQQAAAHYRENPSEGAQAYLFGVLAHYALDSACHPLIHEVTADGKIGHSELETEFDRQLLTQDGVEAPHMQNLASHIRLTWGEAVTAAGFYPPASAFAIRRSAVIMSLVNRLLTLRSRGLLKAILRLGGRDGMEMLMSVRPNHKCTPLIQPLLSHYNEAMERYPRMAAKLLDCINNETPLDEDFDTPFG